jgi:hypothetical protein
MDFADRALINALNTVEHLKNVVSVLEERLRFMQARQDALFIELVNDGGTGTVERILERSNILANATPSVIDPAVAAKWETFLLEAKAFIQHRVDHPDAEGGPLPN